MAYLDKNHIEYIRKTAIEAYHSSAFDSWEDFWRKTIVYRMDTPIPFAGYWDAVELIKKNAWEEERLAHAEGK